MTRTIRTGLYPLVGMLVMLATWLVAPLAHAAAATPTNLSPDDTNVSGIPVLRWDRAPGADSYDVQVSTSSSFATLQWTSNTENLQAVPTHELPAGQVWWRVRSKQGSTTSSWATAQITRSGTAGPTLLSPPEGGSFKQPDPAALSWSPIRGSTKYQVEIGTDPEFTDPARSTVHETTNASYVVQTSQMPATYFWRVRAIIDGDLATSWSATRTFDVEGLSSPSLTAPAGGESNEFPRVSDAVLDWEPVPGARSYELQVSTDINFLNIEHAKSGIVGTSYARPKTLSNDQYYWRVRAVDTFGAKPGWSDIPTWRFQREWPDQPVLQYPADGSVVTDPFFFQWEPTKLASGYNVELSTDPTFPAATTARCYTVHTTYTPVDENSGCWPAAGRTYYWRVIGSDGYEPSSLANPSTDSIAAEVFSFTYRPDVVALTEPADGDLVQVPTLTWEPTAGAAEYRVTITPMGSGSTITATTTATSYTPRSLLTVGRSYRWQVQTLSQDGRLGTSTLPEAQPTFTVEAGPEAVAATPEPLIPLAGNFGRHPTLTWTPVAGATRYRVLVRPANTDSGWTRLSPTFAYPAGEDDSSARLTAGEYEWKVEAYVGTAFLSASTTTASYRLESPQAATHQRAGYNGSDVDTAGESCDATLPTACQNLRQTPVLAWAASPDAAYYKVHVSRDRELTNVERVVTTNNTRWIPTDALPDSQAGSAYYWHVQPCTVDGRCAPLQYAERSFNKLSNPVQLNPPSSTADDITFSWRGYVESHADADTSDSALSTPATIEARQYRVQVSTDPNFGGQFLDDVMVDQRSFTSFDNTYPEGPIYWRVQAFDGNQNPLAWSSDSTNGTFVKRSPSPTLRAPSEGSATAGTDALTWDPLPFAASYEVEIYTNGDRGANATNRVVQTTTAQSSYAPSKPLATSEKPYVWRVRRIDAKSRRGGWSDWGSFRVIEQPPVLELPAVGATVSPSTALFTWKPSAEDGRSVEYRFERRRPGSTSVAQSVTTSAVAYAPTRVIDDGDWEWRVTSLDAAGRSIGSSDWRPFHVIGAPSPTNDLVVDGSGKVGTLLDSKPLTWNLTGVSTTYQWFRGTSAIEGATSSAYTVTEADRGRAIRLKVTGSLPGYRSTVVTSEAITATTGDAPNATKAPVISGTGKVGTTLTSVEATWDVENVQVSYQWLSDGEAIRGADAAEYEIRQADIGSVLSLRATAKRSGYADGMAESNQITAVAGDAPAPTTQPRVVGTMRVGKELTGETGEWPGSPDLSYAWLRNGVPIPGATETTYTLVAKDVRKRIAFRVTAQRSGYEDGTATSRARTVAKMTSRVVAKLSTKMIKRSKRATLTITVRVTGTARPTGKLQVFDGKKRIRTTKLTSAKKGKVTIKLPKLKVGKHRIKVKYLGSSRIKASTSRKVILRVQR